MLEKKGVKMGRVRGVPDGSGPHFGQMGRGKGPGGGRRDGSGMRRGAKRGSRKRR